MQHLNLEKINIPKAAQTNEPYLNLPISQVNDHVVRMSVMTGAYDWHFHPDSDESFLAMEGILIIDLADTSIELVPGELFTVTKNLVHRTRPKGLRSVNLTFESGKMTTIKVDQ